jgi:hypothetical protein
MEDFAYSDE